MRPKPPSEPRHKPHTRRQLRCAVTESVLRLYTVDFRPHTIHTQADKELAEAKMIAKKEVTVHP